jgi:hypothetical protein
LEEEVAVDTGDSNKLAVADGEDVLEGLPRGHGRRYASCYRNESGFVVAALVRNEYVIEMGATY